MTTYTVTQHWTSARRLIADDVPSLREAKRLAARAWSERSARSIDIDSSDGQRLTATQTHGRGMLWTS